MKLYRALDYNNKVWFYDELKNGKYNETINLLGEKVFSPSYEYIRENKRYNGHSHTFLIEEEIVKFFYPSLIDALSWAYYSNGQIIIMEIDLPYDNIKNYFGLGFYDVNKFEVCLPYHYFHELTGDNDLNFEKALSLMEKRELTKEEITFFLSNLDKKEKINNLATFGANALYPYLCYKSKINFSILKTKHNIFFKELIKEIRDSRKKEYINNVDKVKVINQEFLINEAPSIIEEENAEVKKVLARKNYKFINKGV